MADSGFEVRRRRGKNRVTASPLSPLPSSAFGILLRPLQVDATFLWHNRATSNQNPATTRKWEAAMVMPSFLVVHKLVILNIQFPEVSNFNQDVWLNSHGHQLSASNPNVSLTLSNRLICVFGSYKQQH